MSSVDRKAAIAEYKKRKPVPGIYILRCAATGHSWVGRAMDIDTVQTRLWFGLRTGASANRALQSDWNTHGEARFSFEILELLPDDDPPYVRDSRLKDRLAFHREQAGAGQV